MGLRELPQDLIQISKVELNEDPSRIAEELKLIKDWLSKQPHIKARTDDQWLMAFIRSTKHQLERVKEKLDNFYTLKTAYPDFFTFKDPLDEHIQDLLKQGVIVPLPKPGFGGVRVIIMRCGIYDIEKFPITEITCIYHMLLELLLLEDDYFVAAGVFTLIDFDEFSLGNLKQWTPTHLKITAEITQNGFPIRNKGSCYYNVNSTIETLSNLLKSLLNEKIKQRTSVLNNNVELLHKKIPKDILPVEYGGNAGPIQNIIDDLITKMEDHRSWFLENLQYKTDESKRPKKTKMSESLFGIEGTFRGLNVD